MKRWILLLCLFQAPLALRAATAKVSRGPVQDFPGFSRVAVLTDPRTLIEGENSRTHIAPLPPEMSAHLENLILPAAAAHLERAGIPPWFEFAPVHPASGLELPAELRLGPENDSQAAWESLANLVRAAHDNVAGPKILPVVVANINVRMATGRKHHFLDNIGGLAITLPAIREIIRATGMAVPEHPMVLLTNNPLVDDFYRSPVADQTLAHELGHMVGLADMLQRNNLMHGSREHRTSTGLNPAQVNWFKAWLAHYGLGSSKVSSRFRHESRPTLKQVTWDAAHNEPAKTPVADLNVEAALPAVMPVEKHGDVYFRRGDKFHPFRDLDLNGDKVRQVYLLLKANRDKIRREHANTVATVSSVFSPQGLIVARVAYALGFKAIIAAAGPSKRYVLRKHRMMRLVEEIGGKVVVISKNGMNNVMYPRLDKYLRKAAVPAFVVKFGMNIQTDRRAILDSIAEQVRALPRDTQNLVIPVGSGISAAGVLHGLIKYDIHPKRVILVQIAGFDRRKAIDEILGRKYPYEFVFFDDYPYSRRLKQTVGHDERTGEPIALDSIYEAKAYQWLLENIDPKKEKTVFWIIANIEPLRD